MPSTLTTFHPVAAAGSAAATTPLPVEQLTPQQLFDVGVHRKFGLTDDEYARATGLLGRAPNYTELGVISVMWSEHCSYKSTRVLLRELPTEGPHVLQGPGENAGVIDVGHGLAVAFKIESHNHPTAVEPFQGAATGVGGILRDVFAMGARPIALLNSLRFGPLDGDDNARNRYLFDHAVAGIAAYGNCVGVPTVGGEVVFDECYRHNPLVNAMCVGLLPRDEVGATGAARGADNGVILIGARTGRDGIHGATFASVEDPHEGERSAVQVGDPFLEKLLLEATLELLATGEVVGLQDLGAAGLTSSAAEMASRAGSGIDIDAAKVLRRESGMTPYELLLSESQERMLVVMRRGSEQLAYDICTKWELEAAEIGTVTDSGLLRVLDGEQTVAELPVTLLVDDAPVLHRRGVRPAYLDVTGAFSPDEIAVPDTDDLAGILHQLLAAPTIASKEYVYSQYDHMVRAATVVRPGSDAAVVLLPGTDAALAMCTDGNGRYVQLDPAAGAQHAVAEAARNLVCSGARPLAVTNCLNFSTPEDEGVFWQLQQACAGISAACIELGTPVVGGNVSLYNQSHGVDIYPTPVIGMVGVIDRREDITTQAFQQAGSYLLLVGPFDDAGLAGSEYLATVHGRVAGGAPPIDLAVEHAVQRSVLACIKAGLVRSAHDVSDGGLAVTLAESAIDGNIGAAVKLSSNTRIDAQLFGEAASLIVLEVAQRDADAVAALCATRGAKIFILGTTGGDRLDVRVAGKPVIDVGVADLRATWKGAIPALMGVSS